VSELLNQHCLLFW